jgi:hypothetical protein
MGSGAAHHYRAPCAAVFEGETVSLRNGWNAAAVASARAALHVHTALAQALGAKWCVAASQLQEEARAGGRRATQVRT